MVELRKLAWQNGIIPLHRNFSGEVGRVLLPSFKTGSQRQRVLFNISDVAALQEDQNKKFQRIDRAIQGGWLTVAAGKRAVGIDPEEGDDVYLRKISVEAVPPDDQIREPAPDNGIETRSGNGNGKKVLSDIISNLEIKQDEPTGLEARIIAQAPRAEHTTAQTRFMEIQEREEASLSEVMEKELQEFFEELGRKAAEAALPILEELFKTAKKGEDITLGENSSRLEFKEHEYLKAFFKQGPEVEISTARIMEAMNMQLEVPIFTAIYEAHYLSVATESTAEAMGAIGLATDIADPVARAIQATGGTRAGLIELNAQARETLFRAIQEGRALGEGAQQLAARIEQQVPGYWRRNIFGIQGRDAWISPAERAKVIARTETKHAQRMSALIMGRGQDVAHFHDLSEMRNEIPRSVRVFISGQLGRVGC